MGDGNGNGNGEAKPYRLRWYEGDECVGERVVYTGASCIELLEEANALLAVRRSPPFALGKEPDRVTAQRELGSRDFTFAA